MCFLSTSSHEHSTPSRVPQHSTDEGHGIVSYCTALHPTTTLFKMATCRPHKVTHRSTILLPPHPPLKERQAGEEGRKEETGV